MINLARLVALAFLLLATACGRGSGSGGGGGSSPPPGPPLPTGDPAITAPAPQLPVSFLNTPITPVSFTGTGTGTLSWSVTGGTLPPGVGLTPGGVYSGTPSVAGSFTFTATLTGAAGTESQDFTQLVLGSIQELEPNNTAGGALLLPEDVAGTGDLGANDIDFWSFAAEIDDVVSVQVFATRRDFNSWQTNGTIPRVTLFGTDGTSFLTGIDYFAGNSTLWYGGAFDLDITQFRIPATGTYFVRIDHDTPNIPGGEYALRVKFLNLGVLQVEAEDNDSPASPNGISPGTLTGFREDGDDDWYSFAISAPTIVTFEVVAYRNGITGIGGVPDDDYFDPLIELYDTDGSTVLATNDDVFFYDSAIQFVLTDPGTYFLRLTESVTFPSNGDAAYFLTYTDTPLGSDVEAENNDTAANATGIAYGDVISGTADANDTDFFAFNGAAGDIVRVHFFDFGAHQAASDFIDIAFMTDDTTALQSAVSFTSDTAMSVARTILPATGTFFVRVTGTGVLTDYAFRIERFRDAAFESEVNDTPASSDAFTLIGRVAGVLESAGDEDVFSFTAVLGEIVNFSIYAARGAFADFSGIGFLSHDDYGSLLFPVLEVTDSSGNILDATPFSGANFTGESMSNALATSAVTFRATATGTFYIRVADADGFGGPEFLYLLEKD
jgi:hypothetical protein